MDLLTKLNHELQERHLSDFEKVRYIYLRTCELFSFDERYHFTHLFNDEELYLEIINRKIFLNNINNFLVVCHSYSREILIKLIRELTTAEVRLRSGAHSFVEYQESPNTTWELDATYGDFSRAKLEVPTYGFSAKKTNYQDRLVEVDSILGYNHKAKIDYLREINRSSDEEIFISINLLLKNSKCRKEYSDAKFLIRYLLLGLNYQFSDITYVGSDYDFHHVFVPKNDDSIFCLSKVSADYELTKISADEFMRLTRTLKK